MRRTGRSYVVGACALTLLGLVGCSEDPSVSGMRGPAELLPGEDPLDPEKYPEIGGAYAQLALAPLTPAPTFESGTLTITSNAADTIVIGRRAVDSAILVNGVQIGDATADKVKKILVTGNAAASQTLIVDYIGGVFTTGNATATGIDVDLGAGGTDVFRIRGTDAVDTYTVGSDGISINTDKFKDMTIAGVEALSFTLAGGNDVFSATASLYGVTGPFASNTLVFGGVGNDTLVGGAGRDQLYGGPGNDTLSGGIETVPAVDELWGEVGVDTFDQGAENDGADIIQCGNPASGTELDLVTYAKRTQVTVTLSPSATGDDGEAGEGDNIRNDCEIITGGTGADSLTGDLVTTSSPTGVTLNGAAGNDTLRGGNGADILNGDAGDDTFDEQSKSIGDVFNGGAGVDLVDYSGRTGSPALIITMDGTRADDGEADEKDNVKADVENVKGSGGADQITGNTGNNVITGGAGADTLTGLAGDDTFDEGAGPNGGDVFIGGPGYDTVDYGGRSLAVRVLLTGTMATPAATSGDIASNENDSIRDDVENAIGTIAADTFEGNAANNRFDGGGAAGQDTISACGDGDDQVFNTAPATVIPIDCEPFIIVP